MIQTKAQSVNVGTIEWRRYQISTQLSVLGYGKADPVYLRAIPTRSNRTPQTITAPCNNLPIHRLVKLENDGYNIFVTYNGGGHKKSDVKTRRAFVSESDTSTVHEQLEVWWKKGFCEPTLMVHSGNKSVHQYWCLDKPVPVDDDSQLIQSKIIRLLDSDPAMLKAEQPLRLAGFKHPKTGKFTECLPLDYGRTTRYLYSFKELQRVTAHCKPLETKPGKQKELTETVVDINYKDYLDYHSNAEEMGQPTDSQEKALKALVQRCKDATPGTRSDTLASVSFTLGLESGTHNIDVTGICEKLLKIISAWDNQCKTVDTFERQFKAGFTAGQVERQGVTRSNRASLNEWYDLDKYNPVKFTARYIGENIDITQPGVHVVVSPMGTGKTHLLNQLKDKNNVVALTYRSTLEHAMTRGYDDGGLELTSVSKGLDTGRQVCCTDSILKLYSPSKTEYLILDEFDRTLEHTICSKGTTVRDDRTSKFTALKELIQNAPTVVVASADISTLEIDFVLSLRSDVTLYVNEFKPESTVPLTVVKTPNDLLTRLHLDLSNGLPVYVSTDSKNKASVIASDIRSTYPGKRLLLVTSETSGTSEVVRFMRDPSKECVNYDVVVASPTAQTGVDISAVHFHTVYGFLTNWGLDFKGLNQGLRRVRKPQAMTLYLGKPVAASSEDALMFPENIEGVDPVNHPVMHALYVQMKERHNTLRKNTTVNNMTDELCNRNGFELVADPSQVEIADYSERYKELKDELKQEYIQRVLDAPLWGEDDVARYRAAMLKGCVQPEMRYAHDRHFYSKALDAGRPEFSLQETDMEFVLDGGIRKLRNFSRAIMWNYDMVNAADCTEEHWNTRNQVFHLDRSKEGQRTQLVRRVLLGGGILVRHAFKDEHGYESYTLEPMEFTEQSTEHLLKELQGLEGITRELSNGNKIKTGLNLVKLCLESVGIELVCKRTRIQGVKTRVYTPSIDSIDMLINTYYSESKYPWERVCRYAVDSRGMKHYQPMSEEDRTSLDNILKRGKERGYYSGPVRLL